MNNVLKTERTKTDRWVYVVLLLLIVFAGGIRLYRINLPKLFFFPSRQYDSFCEARSLYLDRLENVPEWELELARKTTFYVYAKGPPVMDHLVSYMWYISGGENHWSPSLLASVFWLIGGIFVFKTAMMITSPFPALASTAYYLFSPFGFFMSRSFQPEALMILLLTMSVFAIFNYHQRQTLKSLVLAAIISFAAIFCKFNVIFVIWCCFVAGVLSRKGLLKTLFSRRHILFVSVGLLPAIIYYLYLTLYSAKMEMVARSVVTPDLVFKSIFWIGWFDQLVDVVGYIPLLAGVIGVFFARRRIDKFILSGLIAGYCMFALIFSSTTATHAYYQVQLIPIIALCLCPVFAMIVERIGRFRKFAVTAGIIIVVTLAGLMASIQTDVFRTDNKYLKRALAFGFDCFGINPYYVAQLSNDYTDLIEKAERIGQAVNHSEKTISLAYPIHLWYYGRFTGLRWPHSDQWPEPEGFGAYGTGVQWQKYEGLTAEELFRQHFSDFSPEYFVIADMKEFARQKSLRGFLSKSYEILEENEDFLVFDLTKPKS